MDCREIKFLVRVPSLIYRVTDGPLLPDTIPTEPQGVPRSDEAARSTEDFAVETTGDGINANR